MERLTNRNKHGGAYYPYCFKENTCDGIGTSEKCNDCDFNTRVCEKLAEYEDIEEQGRLIKLPCKIGKNLYDIIEFVEGYESPDIFIIDASRIEISKDKEGIIYTIDGADYREKDFGTVLFTSEEEALKAISEKGWIL